MLLNRSAEQIALMIGGSMIGSIGNMLIGIGSSTININIGSLTSSTDRQNVTSITYPALRKTTWQFDWGVTDVSGTTLTEFGILPSGGGLTGSLWSRNVIPSLVFDGYLISPYLSGERF